jgi:uncharacterized protein (TIGR03790 family)
MVKVKTLRSLVRLSVALLVGIAACPQRAEAQTGANVLLVENTNSATSNAIARHYAARRAVPQENVCLVNTVLTESITREAFDAQIARPIWKCVSTSQGHDRILYIVLTKDVPIRIIGTAGRTGTVASVDSELTLLYRRAVGVSTAIAGFVANPYFAGAAAVSTIEPFDHHAHDIFLVTRLDGYTREDALALVDRSMAAGREGRFVLDERASLLDSGGDAWLREAAERLRGQGMGDRTLLESSSAVVRNETNVLGYYSWGSNDAAARLRHLDTTFVPGALAAMFVSTDARTFKEPPAEWAPGNTATRATIFGGSHQSLVADLIRDGVTGAAGHVDEPFLDATIRPQILFPAYVSGRNLAESFYAAMPYLSWQTIVLGDPLCAPFQHGLRTAREIDPGLDPQTELPLHFAKRRLMTVPGGINNAAAVAWLRAGSRTARGDSAGARQALEASIAANPQFTTARLELATLYSRSAQHDAAIMQLRAVVGYEPTNAAALNDLAFYLAVKANKPQEALMFAERANTLVKNNAAMLDTLAWIQHLLGRDVEAAANMRLARTHGQNPELLWHAAVIYSAANDPAAAATELTLALKAQPDLADLDEVKKLRQQLAVASK